MTTTTNLAVTLIEQNQAGKHVTANEAFDAFDRAFADSITVNAAGNPTPYTIPDPDPARRFIRCVVAGALGAPYAVILPAARKLSIGTNSTTGGYAVTFRTASGTGVSVVAGDSKILFNNGTDVEAVTVSPPGALPFDVGTFVAGKPGSSEVVMRFVFTRDVTFPAAMAGSVARAGTAATASTTFNLARNGTNFGTAVFAASAAAASFTAAAGSSFVAGDILSVTAPATADASLNDISFTFAGSRA